MKNVKIKEKEWSDVKSHHDFLKNYNQVILENENQNDVSKHIMALMASYPKLEVVKKENAYVIALEQTKIGLLTLQVDMKGKTYKFLIDTGAEMSCITQELVDDLHIMILSDQIPVGDAAGYKKIMKLCLLDMLDLQGTQFKNIPMLVLQDELKIKMFGINVLNVDGVLGWDLLSYLDFEIDLNRQLMLITKGKTSHRNMVKSEFPIVFVIDENQRLLKFGLDLGSKKSWMSKNYCASRAWHFKREKTKYIRGIHGPVKATQNIVGPFHLKLGKHDIRYRRISTGFTAFVNDLTLDGVFGLDILKHHKLVVYNSQSVLLLENYENKFI
ncbi:MAG: clan AA aspartic protease [Clostridia bacterium]|nr:clan AA aspartic protease [Clostridia bacterium]